jgi:hypothetical protein
MTHILVKVFWNLVKVFHTISDATAFITNIYSSPTIYIHHQYIMRTAFITDISKKQMQLA